LDAAAAYMARMERLNAVNSAVAADDGNDSGGGQGGEAGAPGGNGIARVNCQAVVVAAAVEEEEEEGAVDRDGDHAANSDGGPVAHGDREDGDKSAAPRTGRMTTTTAATATGGIRIVPRKASWIIATTARPIATIPAVAAKLGMAVAAAAAAEAAGTATEKNGGGGNTKAEENLHL
jgi:hypothetical protein